MKTLLKKRRGFTLVEILVVILVIGLLFLFFIPKIDFASGKAKETGVKSDFRSYSLAAEQLMRENSGLGSHTTLTDAAAGINLYLDPALQFNDAGVSTQKDPWNQPYSMQAANVAGSNNGAILVMSGGKDGALDGADDYAIGTVYIDGAISSATTGFSSNIESNAISGITAGADTGFTVTGGTAALTYRK